MQGSCHDACEPTHPKANTPGQAPCTAHRCTALIEQRYATDQQLHGFLSFMFSVNADMHPSLRSPAYLFVLLMTSAMFPLSHTSNPSLTITPSKPLLSKAAAPVQ